MGGDGVLIGLIVVSADAEVFLCAVTLVIAASQTITEVVVDRTAESDAVTLRELVGEFDKDIQVQLVGGPLVYEAHCAGDGITAVQRALRPSRHLDPREVEHMGRSTIGLVAVNTVNVESYGLVGWVCTATWVPTPRMAMP